MKQTALPPPTLTTSFVLCHILPPSPTPNSHSFRARCTMDDFFGLATKTLRAVTRRESSAALRTADR